MLETVYDLLLDTLKLTFPNAEINLWKSQDHTFWLTLIDPTLDTDQHARKTNVWSLLYPIIQNLNCNICIAAIHTPQEQQGFVNHQKASQLLRQYFPKLHEIVRKNIHNMWNVIFDKTSNSFVTKIKTNHLPDFLQYQSEFLLHDSPQQWHFIVQTLTSNNVYTLLLPHMIPLTTEQPDEPIIVQI